MHSVIGQSQLTEDQEYPRLVLFYSYLNTFYTLQQTDILIR